MSHQDTKAPREPVSAELDTLARQVVDAAFKVHTALGPGLLESVYETCLCHELGKRSLKVARQVGVPVFYDGLRIEAGFRVDLLVEDALIVEIKAAEMHNRLFEAQLLTYLKLTGLRLGLLINFGVPQIKHGIRRFIL
ncbi:GxxExxY protein [Telmatospirillum sp. J64-1]|uniref:GxxExxY protein n=1 Tax=Telmatospirillum sp. J64-1 TaxID=2502183 RepID=UPI00115D8FF9|nr:GxxExxY protein [Telmatospirillum sp. J64-1]